MDVPTECRVNIKLKVNLLMNQTAVSANGFQNDCSFEIKKKKKKRKEIKRNHSTFIFGVGFFLSLQPVLLAPRWFLHWTPMTSKVKAKLQKEKGAQ